ncbi:GSCOCG00004553001-RA-CDS, partial [Cotesia congregata]
ISLKPFGEHIKMWLNPVDGILAGEDLPIYTLSSDPNNRSKVKTEKHVGYMKYALSKLYENTLHATTLAINYHPDGKKSMVRKQVWF